MLILIIYILITGIYNKIIENGIPFEGGLTTLSSMLKKLGFRFVHHLYVNKLHIVNVCYFSDGKKQLINERH